MQGDEVVTQFTPSARPERLIKLTDKQRAHRDLLTDFMKSFPEVDDVLVYTFDQRAWLCSEFGPCPRCSGLPLDERLPGFLNLLNDTMQACRSNTRLWWKPWELSKGQVVAILDKVKPDQLGLVLNPSTSNEVYPFDDRSFKSDLGVKRLVRLAWERNIPVLGEFDHTLYKPLYLMEDFFPRLIYGQMVAWKEMEGVVGVKEYYGFAPSTFSVNAAMLQAWKNRSSRAAEHAALRLGPQTFACGVEIVPGQVQLLDGPRVADKPGNKFTTPFSTTACLRQTQPRRYNPTICISGV